MQVSHVHVMLHCTQCLFTNMHSSNGGGGGGGHISVASRGSGGMLLQKIFCILRWTLT